MTKYTSKFYNGAYSPFKPEHNNYISNANSIGLGTDARTANIMGDFGGKVSTGTKTVELTQVFPQVFDAIPQEQLKEVNRLAKMNNVDITFHAPIVGLSPAGMTQQGGFDESQRKSVEKQMMNNIKRSRDLNSEGGMPITFHANEGIPETYEREPDEDKKEYAINIETKQIAPLPVQEKNFPGDETKGKSTQEQTENTIKTVNEQGWTQQLQHLAFNTERAAELINAGELSIESLMKEREKGKPSSKALEQGANRYDMGKAYLDDSYRELKESFNQAYRYAKGPEDKKLLDNFKKEIENEAKQINKIQGSKGYRSDFEREKEIIRLKRGIVDKGFKTLQQIEPPRTYKPLKKFAREKTLETFSNVALDTYKKYGKKAPTISIEHSYAGQMFSTGSELKGLIQDIQKQFVNKATKPKNKGGLGISKSKAKKASKEFIGATWDLGRINSLRKKGFTEKEIIKQSEEIAPMVKQVHLSDNFGFETTELPMGMGNAPYKEVLKKLKEKGYKGKKTVEALNWYEHFKTTPYKETLDAMESPIYSAKAGGPYWSVKETYQPSYNSGYGRILPQVNYESFGASFSQLPTELGGKMQGASGNRFGGAPME